MRTKEVCDAEFKKKKFFVIKDEKSIHFRISCSFDLRQFCGKMAFPPPRVEKDYFKQTHKMCVTSEASELYI